MDDRLMVTEQLQALSSEQAEQVLQTLNRALSEGGLTNPIGWMLSVLKRARNGKLFAQKVSAPPVLSRMTPSPVASDVVPMPEKEVSTTAHVQSILADIRRKCKVN